MILEYFSLEKGPFTEHWGRLKKFLHFYFRIITSYLKMSGMPWLQIWKQFSKLMFTNGKIVDQDCKKYDFIQIFTFVKHAL